MKRNFLFFFVFFLILSFALTNFIYARGNKNRGQNSGKNRGNKGSKMASYEKSTFTTIKGKIKNSNVAYNKTKNEKGLHLTVETPEGNYIVHVCPNWYAEKEKIKFNNGETVTISGSTFIKDNEKNIYAADLTSASGKTLNLRNTDTGEGLWKGRNQQCTQESKTIQSKKDQMQKKQMECRGKSRNWD